MVLQGGARGPPVVPTAPTGDCSNRAASTEFVCEATAGITWGPTGPTGPAGPDGTTGATGATGSQGTPTTVGPFFANQNSVSAASATPIMAGYGAIINATKTTQWFWMLAVTVKNTAPGTGVEVSLRKGTGIPPSFSDPVTGTAISTVQRWISADGAEVGRALVIGTFTTVAGNSFWLDLAFNTFNGGTATLALTLGGVQTLALEL